MKMKQIKLLKDEPKAYGGELLKTRKGRSGPRPIDTRNTIHLVLRSSKAVKEWSFRLPRNEKKIGEIIYKFAKKYGVKIILIANVGSHLHFQIKLSNRWAYKPFIRAITSAIAMAVTGMNRWTRKKNSSAANENLSREKKLKFWDYRPFTRVIQSFRALINLRDYIQINQLEGFGLQRPEARFILEKLTRVKSKRNNSEREGASRPMVRVKAGPRWPKA
jgi:hypothetical protein